MCILLYLAVWAGYESIYYCTIRAKKWENRGFLYGPLCPIYGAGGVAITAIADFISVHTDATFTWWQIFLVAFFGSIVLEYGTSWALEKLFHAYWWDYSSMPLNINGRVCFPYSVGFLGWQDLLWYILLHRLRSSSQAGCHLYGMSFLTVSHGPFSCRHCNHRVCAYRFQ